MKRILILSLLTVAMITLNAASKNYQLLIGTYTSTGVSKGIYSYTVNVEEGIFTQQSVASEMKNPSYLALSADKKMLYAIGETDKASRVGAYAFDEQHGTFKFINSALTVGRGPCFICVTDKHVFTANYGGGSLSVIGRNPDGSLTELVQLIEHAGGSIDPKRQTKSYVHQVSFTPDGKYLIANDLGTDKVVVYRYDPTAASKVLVPYDSVKVKLGSGPRHITFSKNGKYAYLMQEMDGTVTAFSLDNGKLKIIQETTVVKKQGIENGGADIHLSPDGKFLYATNRGTANDISCFKVEKDGKLTFVQQVSTGGEAPRNFALTPDGDYVFVANQRSDNIVLFKRDKKSGCLTDTGRKIMIGAPVCLLFY